MPLGFKGNILTTSSSAVVAANTQAATWEIKSGATGWSSWTNLYAFGDESLMGAWDGSNYTTDSKITVYPQDSSFYFNTSNTWTIEFWIGFTGPVLIDQPQKIINITNDEFLSEYTNDNFETTWNTSQDKFSVSLGNTGAVAYVSTSSSLQHFAFQSDGNGRYDFHANGQRQYGSTGNSNSTSARSVAIGMIGSRNFNNEPRIVIDEIRISNIRRYPNFQYTVPTSAFTTDENTLALFHCDGNRDDSSRA
jgi:hypothetical protein